MIWPCSVSLRMTTMCVSPAFYQFVADATQNSVIRSRTVNPSPITVGVGRFALAPYPPVKVGRCEPSFQLAARRHC